MKFAFLHILIIRSEYGFAALLSSNYYVLVIKTSIIISNIFCNKGRKLLQFGCCKFSYRENEKKTNIFNHTGIHCMKFNITLTYNSY